LQPVDFFLLKRRRFNFFKKKLTRTTRLKPGTWALDQTGFKNYGFKYLRESIAGKWDSCLFFFLK
jgi:hypothetical protein